METSTICLACSPVPSSAACLSVSVLSVSLAKLHLEALRLLLLRSPTSPSFSFFWKDSKNLAASSVLAPAYTGEAAGLSEQEAVRTLSKQIMSSTLRLRHTTLRSKS